MDKVQGAAVAVEKIGGGRGDGSVDTGADGRAVAVAGTPDEPVVGAPEDRTGRVERWAGRLLVAALVVPVVVSAAALVVGVGTDYMPAADYALTEMQVRDVGREPVLVGLFSRDEWNHPGPALFYLLAPFYLVTGGASIGLHLGALAINGAALVGMAYLARRRGGTPLMLLTVLGAGLLLRSLGADFVHDPWNCFITALPYGLLIFLAWSMTCGDAWALPVGVGVASFLAQTHVGFVALGLPLVAWGAVGLVLVARRAVPAAGDGTPGDGAGDGDGAPVAPDDAAAGRVVDDPVPPAGDVPAGGSPGAMAGPMGLIAGLGRLRRPLVVAAVVAGVLWLPPLVDVAVNAPSNVREIVDWFGEGDDEVKTLGQGWSVMAGQFGGAPEWLAGKKPPVTGGESPYLKGAPFPWALLLVAAAAAWLWRRGGDGRRLAALVGVTLAISVAAVVRTVGPAFDYRLRWTWVPPAVAAIMAAWAGWQALVRRRPGLERALLGLAGAGVVVLTGVNTVTAATTGTPHEGDSAALEALMPDVLDELGDEDGQVVVSDVFANGSWYARGIVLQLERQGYDARAPEHYADLFGESRVADEPGDARLWVAMDDGIEQMAQQPDLRLVAEWQGVTDGDLAEAEEARSHLDESLASGEMTEREHFYGTNLVGLDLHDRSPATAYAVAVFVEDRS